MKHKWLVAGAIIATSHCSNAMTFDNCFTWDSRELAIELSHEFNVVPNEGKCQSLPYTDQLIVRERRHEMLKMASILYLKADLDGYISFYEKYAISKDLKAIYGNHALLYIGPK